ncbi:MAG: polyphenol oxidase family protein [Actinomycetota bacterium]|nr:polyphenol oxidase family protein [Actinomycetota bacterium]
MTDASSPLEGGRGVPAAAVGTAPTPPGPPPGLAQPRARSPIGVRLAEDPRAHLAFTGRRDGNLSWVVGGGDVAAARAGLLGLVGLGPDDAVFMEQVHGGAVMTVGPDDRGRGARARGDAIPGADALVTFADDVALVVLVADCVPLLLVDPGRGVAAVHAGRRGVESAVVAAAVSALADPPSSVIAVIGPAIGGCCYEVPAAMAEAVSASVPAARATTSWGAPALDLPGAVRAQLETLGVARIQRVGSCTRCGPQRWFSHRAPAAGAGRQAGVVCRRVDQATRPVAPGGKGGPPSLQW